MYKSPQKHMNCVTTRNLVTTKYQSNNSPNSNIPWSNESPEHEHSENKCPCEQEAKSSESNPEHLSEPAGSRSGRSTSKSEAEDRVQRVRGDTAVKTNGVSEHHKGEIKTTPLLFFFWAARPHVPCLRGGGGLGALSSELVVSGRAQHHNMCRNTCSTHKSR